VLGSGHGVHFIPPGGWFLPAARSKYLDLSGSGEIGPVSAPPPQPADEFRDQADAPQPGLVAEFWDFLKHNKKWWLLPILAALLLLGALVALSGTALAPFIYPLI
jgi:hypothetical protein